MESVSARNTLDSERWISTFVEDGELIWLSSVEGPDQLREVAGNWSEDVSFQLTSIDIQPIDATTAKGQSLATISWPSNSCGDVDRQSIAPVSALLLYLDDFELTEEGCKIVRREELEAFVRDPADTTNDR